VVRRAAYQGLVRVEADWRVVRIRREGSNLGLWAWDDSFGEKINGQV
jgi:hypothetical protein